MSSNVGQNYPYASESEPERAAAVEKALAQFDGLRDKVAAETSPLGPPDPQAVAPPRWWVWV